MLKSNRQAKSFIKEICNKVAIRTGKAMQRDTKNLKISPDVHHKLKMQAAEHQIPIMDYADLLLTWAMSEQEEWKKQRASLVNNAKKRTAKA